MTTREEMVAQAEACERAAAHFEVSALSTEYDSGRLRAAAATLRECAARERPEVAEQLAASLAREAALRSAVEMAQSVLRRLHDDLALGHELSPHTMNAAVRELAAALASTDDAALKVVRELKSACENLNIAVGMGWDLEGVQQIAGEACEAAARLFGRVKP